MASKRIMIAGSGLAALLDLGEPIRDNRIIGRREEPPPTTREEVGPLSRQRRRFLERKGKRG